jgi:hypothetical protein
VLRTPFGILSGEKTMETAQKNRSIFWPLALVAAGGLWLLVNVGIVANQNLWALLHVLPYVLIALGIGVLLRARWPVAGMLVTAFIVLGIVLTVIFAPQLGWAAVPPWNFGTSFGGGVAGSGLVVSEERAVNGIQAVSFKYPAQVFIRQGDSDSMSIEAEDNLLPQLSSRVINGVLIFENKEKSWNKRVNPTKLVHINMTVKDLRNADFSTAGSVNIEGLNTDAFKLSVSGAGEVNLDQMDVRDLNCSLSGVGSVTANGKAGHTELSISGMGSYNGAEVSGQSANVDISGAGSATLWLESSLNASISGAGSVSYYGSPTVSRRLLGVGSLNDLGSK